MWGSNMVVRVGLRFGYGRVFAVLPLFTLSNVIVNGPMRICLDRLMPAMTFFGSLKLSFPSPPDIRFSVSTLVPYDLTTLPGVGLVLNYLVRSAVMSFMGFPKEYAVDMDEGAMGDPDGMLHIRNVKIQGMRGGKLRLSAIDPFVRFTTTRSGEKEPNQKVRPLTQRRTETKMNSKSAEWREEYWLPVQSVKKHQLTVQVMHDDDIDEELMREHFALDGDLSDIAQQSARGGFHDVRATQTMKDGAQGGILSFQVMYKPFAQISDEQKAVLSHVYSRSPQKQQGNLSVRIDRCFGLMSEKASAKVVVTVYNRQGKALMSEETKVDPETRNPIFGEAFDFCNIDAACKLECKVVNEYKVPLFSLNVKNRIFKKKNLGTVEVPVFDVVIADRIVENFMLKEVTSGQLKMSLEWTTIWPSDASGHRNMSSRSEDA